MNNLFDFATKELSQDAFLRWLIECANVNDAIASVSKAFLKWLTGRDGEVNVVRTVAQWHRIDIVAELFYPETNEAVLLAIEDKVDMEEHDNQLKRYGGLLDPQDGKWSYDKKNVGKICQPIKAFYKTALLDPDEQNRVKEAKWKIIELDRIVEFFRDYLNFGHSEIIRHYAAHILRRQKDSKEISLLPMTGWNIVNFQTWFREKLNPFIGKELPQLVLDGKIYQGHYFSCYASRRFEDKDDRGVCLEIIFRPEDENGIGGVLYPRNSDGQRHLPPKKAWDLSNDRFNGYREELICIVDSQSKGNKWSAFKTPNKNASVRIGSFCETISLDGKEPDAILLELRDILEEFYWLFDADRETRLPQCRRATDSTLSAPKAFRENACRAKKGGGAKSIVTSSMITKALKELMNNGNITGLTLKHGWEGKAHYSNNLFSETMDKLLPPRQNGEGAWPGCKEIYRFWVRPTEPSDGVDGVKLTLELGPGSEKGEKEGNLRSLPEESQNNMTRIGGEPFEEWCKNPDGREKKFAFEIQKVECKTTQKADVYEAVRNLLAGLDEWQKDPVCKDSR